MECGNDRGGTNDKAHNCGPIKKRNSERGDEGDEGDAQEPQGVDIDD